MLTEPGWCGWVGPASGRIGPVDAQSTALAVEFAQQTSVGAQRAVNEDAIGCWPSDGGVVLAVADGLGGYDDGEVASRIALESLTRALAASPPDWRPVKRLRHAVEQANLAVYDQGQGRMRTTLTATLLGPATLTTAHVGDCRLLLWRDAVLRQLTADHNVAGELAEYGFQSAGAGARDPRRRLLTRCLGQDPYVRIDTMSRALKPGDVYLQGSDGIATLSGSCIMEILANHDPATASDELIRHAQEAGGGDDTSVQVARVVSCLAGAEPRSWLDAFRRGTLLGRSAP